MIRNFTYLTLFCAVSMLLIIGGVLLTKLPPVIQIAMIIIGLIGGIIGFISSIRLLLKQEKK
ncbi:hypothetical protein [Bacillus ndiopicus]|uniref:hypothetical protein n=1 Tax=Bacillus ndiopicus TaxID=1347368 RepID=UPI0005AA9295|nr:hypothetical protein [Bacillus ndiopicus]